MNNINPNANAEERSVPEAEFIEGYFASRCQQGEEPRRGYPINHLPEPEREEYEYEIDPGIMA